MRTQIYRFFRDLFVSGRGQLYLLALAAICLAVEGVYVALVPPVSGYETSIYEPYPLLFWIALFLSIALVVGVLLTSSVSSQTFYGRALTLLAANYGMLLFLPTFRGYQLHDNGSGDLLAHLGQVRTIVSNGNVPDLWYPFEHMLMAVFTVFGVPLEESSMVFTVVFLTLFATTTGILMRSLLRRKFALAAGTAAAIPMLMADFTVSAAPSIFSIFLIPIVMTFAHRCRRTLDKRYLSLLCLTAFSIIVFHPATSAFVVLLLFLTWVFNQFYGRLSARSIPTPDWNIALAMLPIMFIWYTSFDKTWFMANQRIQALMGTSSSAVEATAGKSAALTLQQTVIRFVQIYGAVFIYLIIATVVTVLIGYRFYHHWSDVTYPELYLSFLFGIGFLILIVFMLTPLEASAPIRNSRFMTVLAVCLVSLSLIGAMRSNYRRSIATVLAGAIVISTVLSVGTVYQPNMQMTQSEFEGVEYMIEHHDPSVIVYHLRITYKGEDYIHSVPRSEIDTYHFGKEGKKLPSRLGYMENKTAAETFGNAFLVTKESDTEFYKASYYFPQQQEKQFVFNESDKSKLRTDVTVDKVYENGGFEGWRVNDPTETGQ